jgi:ubiquinone biosynthesis protein
MKNSPENPSRLKEIYLVLKHREIVKGLTPEKLRLILEDFGPTFVKLGQILSMRNDILPSEYCTELEKLRADVNQISIEEIRHVIESEYNQTLEDVFDVFYEKPLGSASIAQVHFAKLKDGTEVVVKVQRPHIREVMAKDFSFLRKASKALNLMPVGEMIDFNMVINELWAVSQQELDFLVEARNLEEFYDLNKDVQFVTSPIIETRMTTSKVLVMEYINGFSVNDKDKIKEFGYDVNEIGTKLVDNYMKQIMEDGFFHADPHPGNILIREGKIVWIDMGMMGRISSKDKLFIKNTIKAIVLKDVNEIKNILMQVGVFKGQINQMQLYADIDNLIERYGKIEIGQINMGKTLEELMAIAASHHIAMPKGVSMLGRGMITLEGVISTLCPDINVVTVASNRILKELKDEFNMKNQLKKGVQKLYTSSDKVMDMPALAADLMKNTLRGQTKVNLDLTGSKEPLAILNAMVTKLIVSILAASLLLGSSIVSTTNMSPKTLGIPTLGFVGYVAAMVLSIWLIITSKRKQ